MDTLPDVGTKVCYTGSTAIGPCRGVVVKHFADFDHRTLRTIPFTPDGWHLSVQVDERPEKWPYPNTDRFAPAVAQVEPYEPAEPEEHGYCEG